MLFDARVVTPVQNWRSNLRSRRSCHGRAQSSCGIVALLLLHDLVIPSQIFLRSYRGWRQRRRQKTVERWFSAGREGSGECVAEERLRVLRAKTIRRKTRRRFAFFVVVFFFHLVFAFFKVLTFSSGEFVLGPFFQVVFVEIPMFFSVVFAD